MPGLTACLFYGDRTSEATTIPPRSGGTPNVIRLIARGGTHPATCCRIPNVIPQLLLINFF